MSLIGNASPLCKCPECGAPQSTNEDICHECGSIIETDLSSDDPLDDQEEDRDSAIIDSVENGNQSNISADGIDSQELSKDREESRIVEKSKVERPKPPKDSLIPPSYGSDALAVSLELEDEAPLISEPPPAESSRDTLPQDEIENRETGIGRITPQSNDIDLDGDNQSTTRDSSPPVEPSEVRILSRPPILASEVLQEEVAPAEPGRGAIRALLVLIGIIGSIATLVLVGTDGIGTSLCCAFLALTALAIPPIPFAARAAAVVIISASTLGVVTWMHVVRVGTPTAIVETISVMVLATALLFRAWHRASILARLLVAVGIVFCVSWLGMTGMLNDFTTLDPAWQIWLPAILRIPLAFLLIVSLLAFMDAKSTGGCKVWAIVLLIWYGIYMGVQFLIYCWPQGTAAPLWPQTGSQSASVAISMIVSPFLTVLVVYGLAQLLAVAMSVQARR